MEAYKFRITDEHMYLTDPQGCEYKQSILWYSRLLKATQEQRGNFELSTEGIHWRALNEDVSFDSFLYECAEPTPMQRFFLTHREINIAEFANRIGINASLLRNYINGFKGISKEREELILQGIKSLGNELREVTF